MTRKVSNFSNLIQRVTASCLLHPFPNKEEEEECHSDSGGNKHEEDNKEIPKVEERIVSFKVSGEEKKLSKHKCELMEEVFETVSALKRAYMSLQEAHCPWDPEKIRVADMAVVAELNKLGLLKERFHKGRRRGKGGNYDGGVVSLTLTEVVAPYEAVMKELKKEVKAKDLEVQNLKEKIESVVTLSSSSGNEKKTRKHYSKKKLGSSGQIQVVEADPSPQLFEATMVQVREASKSFSSLLLSLMHSAHWDITATVCSIEAATTTTDKYNTSATTLVSAQHAKYALESYIFRKFFQGFDHENFYTDGSLSSLLNPDQFRRDCFTQYSDMKSMDPTELLGVLPTCHFGKFCSKKYLAIVHPKMEESLFGNLDHHSQVSAGNHPRTQFYNELLGVAKAVWLLHLLAFSLNPSPSYYEASRGVEFHPHYMDSVVKFAGGRVPAGQVVGFPVSPGFKLGNGTIIKARVYLMTRT
ncbi:hypothetical protein SESBI_17974 [Sesbania bispinosa]|nr:hypothetical protein SESBI_17974 [Sesbania bispinosa]